MSYSPADTAGIEFGGGKVFHLVKTGSTLTRGATGEYEGNVSILDTTDGNGPGSYQLDVSNHLGGSNSRHTRTSEDGRFLEVVEGMTASEARYVRARPLGSSLGSDSGIHQSATDAQPSSGDASTAQDAGTVPTMPAPKCGIEGAPHAYTSTADVSAHIAGRWRICSGAIYLPADTQGIEFGGSRAWLLVDKAGTLVRGFGWDYERDVVFFDLTHMNGPGSYQFSLRAGFFTNFYFTRVSQSGDVLELDEGTSGKKAILARVP